MSGAISATTLAMVGIGAAGSVGGALIGANAAGNAASTQANAADKAAQLQYQASQNALDFQKQQWNTQQQNLAPWLQSGKGALGNLDYLMGIGSPTQAGFPGAPQQGQPGGPNMPSGMTGPNPGMPGQFGSNPARQFPSASPAYGGGNMGNPNQPGAFHTGPAQLPAGGPAPGYAAHTPSISSMQGALGQSGSPVLPNHGPVPVAAGHVPPVGSLGSAVQGQPGASSPGGAFGSLMQPYQGHFVAPTGLTEQNDPGYQARLNLGMQAMDRSAAARGSVLTGGTAQAENQAAQDYGSNEYGNVYNRAFNEYTQGLNQFELGQQNQYNRLAGMSGMGQQTAQQLGYLGNQAAQGVSNNLLSTAGMMGQDYQNAGAANASGYYNQAQAWNQGISGGLGALSQYQQLQKLQQMQNGGYPGGSVPSAGMDIFNGLF